MIISMKVPCLWVVVGLVQLIATKLAWAATQTNGCDSTVWDDNVPERGVYMVTGVCAEGHVDWRHPHGSVRINLQLPSSVSTSLSSDLVETCFIAKSHLTLSKISLERNRNVKMKNARTWKSRHPKDIGPYATIHSNDNLETLVILNNSVPFMEREICFLSKNNAPVVLYLEAKSDMRSTTSGHVELDYDMRRPSERHAQSASDDDVTECRPCSDTEILEAVCSADFVVRASVDAVLHNEKTQESHLRVRIHNIHKQRQPVFKRNSISDSTTRSSPVTLSPHHNGGSIVAPLKCGVQKGRGKFLFIGQIKLRKPFLECAPRVQYFEELWKAAVQIGVNPCTLD